MEVTGSLKHYDFTHHPQKGRSKTDPLKVGRKAILQNVKRIVQEQ